MKRLFSSSSLCVISVVLSAYLRLLIFLPAILVPACASFSPTCHMMYSSYKLNKQSDNIQPWHNPFTIWNGFNCCFLTCIQISQGAGKVVWYSHHLKKIPQFSVIYTVKGFGIVNKAEVDVFLELACVFQQIQQMLAICSLLPLPFLNAAWIFGSSWFIYCWSPSWRILSITLLACEMSAIVG